MVQTQRMYIYMNDQCFHHFPTLAIHHSHMVATTHFFCNFVLACFSAWESLRICKHQVKFLHISKATKQWISWYSVYVLIKVAWNLSIHKHLSKSCNHTARRDLVSFNSEEAKMLVTGTINVFNHCNSITQIILSEFAIVRSPISFSIGMSCVCFY